MMCVIHVSKQKTVPYKILSRLTAFGLPSARFRRSKLACLLGLALLAATLSASCSNRTDLDDSVKKLTFSTLSGRQISLKDAQGPLLVSFWSTSCTICLEEMPELVALYEDYVDQGFELLAIAMPYDPPNEVLELAERRSLPFPVALDIKGDAVAAFGSVKGTPTSFLIDSEGRLVKRYVGAIHFEKLREKVSELVEIS